MYDLVQNKAQITLLRCTTRLCRHLLIVARHALRPWRNWDEDRMLPYRSSLAEPGFTLVGLRRLRCVSRGFKSAFRVTRRCRGRSGEGISAIWLAICVRSRRRSAHRTRCRFGGLVKHGQIGIHRLARRRSRSSASMAIRQGASRFDDRRGDHRRDEQFQGQLFAERGRNRVPHV